ncbi:MAG: permease [Candidatus Gastranaerophilales bacterium]|nr:permease [Candidatus Gastranaerophilales bacterium]
MWEKVFYEFVYLTSELIALFIGISFIIAFIQMYLSEDKIKKFLTTKNNGTNALVGAGIGMLTPFCSCSTIPLLIALFKAKAPFSGAISYLIASPILNPIIVILFLNFFGFKATIIYISFTFLFAVSFGLILDKAGFAKEVKPLPEKQKCCCSCNSNNVIKKDTLQFKAKAAFLDAYSIFKGVFGYILLGAAIGAFIHGVVPEAFISKIIGKAGIFEVPIASIIGVPLYVRASTMIPIADVLINKGVALGTMVALIIGGAGISIPEIILLNSIFKKKMLIVFVISVLAVAIITGCFFNLLF